jgi:uncharacterized membrane protein
MTRAMPVRVRRQVSAVRIAVLAGFALLALLLWFNSYSGWISQNGGLASWVQAIGSLYAIAAVSFPVFVERGLALERARQSMLASARMACDLMSTVALRAFDETAKFSEWWVPQWRVIDEVMASCPIHEIQSAEALEAFVTIRELYGRMRSWDETSTGDWPLNEGSMQSYVTSLCMSAKAQLDRLDEMFGQPETD